MWLGVDGVGYIERLRSTINDHNVVESGRLVRLIVSCLAREMYPAHDVRWIREADENPIAYEIDDTFGFSILVLRIADLKISACPYVTRSPRELAVIDAVTPIRVNFVLGDAHRNIGDHVSPMLTVYLYPDGSLTTYEGSAGERVLPIAWLERCRQIKDGLVTPAPVHVESTMPDAHRVAPVDDGADLGL
jgi:hypothetical protein